ncbi:hypothetical protein CK203_114966 [Vitis vinifera]|uniref:Uncharacterized protein n=1 Tax=Vitis vinifera TaxID=29760 RepID=A0A438E0B9_VITVI|nr:hypothetical protein CK203_114966 [Vitis vinifera]
MKLCKKNKAMENKSTNPSKEGKSAKIPPPRGQVLFKMFERVKGAVAEKNSKARVQTSPDEVAVAVAVAVAMAVAEAVVVETSNKACILSESND